MTKTGNGGSADEKSRKDQRDERLAVQLRANLKRRKAMSKARDSSPSKEEVPKILDET